MKKIMENELNMVTGGYIDETALDSQALYYEGLMDEEFDDWDLIFHWCKNSAKVDAGWAKAGITSVTRPWVGYNKYYYKGERISREDAMRIIGVI